MHPFCSAHFQSFWTTKQRTLWATNILPDRSTDFPPVRSAISAAICSTDGPAYKTANFSTIGTTNEATNKAANKTAIWTAFKATNYSAVSAA